MLNRHCAGLVLVLFFLIPGCVTVPPAPPVLPPVLRYEALIRLSPHDYPVFADDLDLSTLKTAVKSSRTYFERQPVNQQIVLGPDTYTVKDMRDSMALLMKLIDESKDSQTFFAEVAKEFTIYQSTGTDPVRTVVFTSYYEPTIAVRAKKDDVYRYPIYARPTDLITADLGAFDPAWQGSRISGRVKGRSLVPYSTRADIDQSASVLQNQGLELAWSNNQMEVLDLQIEGSGWLEYDDPNANSKKVRIRYDGDNGHKFRSVGQYIISSGRIPAKTFTREKFWKYMNDHPKERQKLLNVNARYIFFRLDYSDAAEFAFGNIDVALTPGRSIATDPTLFPKGALAWIDISSLAAGKWGSALPTSNPAVPTVQRFVLNQDEGGAIKGPGRVDVFAGQGKDAKMFATRMWNKGRLFFLVKKKTS